MSYTVGMQRFAKTASGYGAKITFILILAASAAFMIGASRGDSATMDELAHIPAGYGYVRELDFRLNPEHPPLLKALAGFPVLFLNPNFQTDHKSWREDVNGQWDAGRVFLYESTNDADKIIQTARIGPILLTLLLAFFVFIWSSKLLGRLWALAPAFLFALSPHTLAHGHYVTTDIAAAFGVLVAMYFYIRFLELPSRKHLIWAGVAFGVAQLLKFSAVLLFPHFLILAVLHALVRPPRGSPFPWKVFLKGAAASAGQLAVVFMIAYALIVYPAYFIFTANYPIEKQAGDTTSILASFADGPPADGESCKPARCLAELTIAMSKNPVTRPAAEYLLGLLMVIQRSSGGNTNYFLGEVSASGWWYYFPLTYLYKEPLPVIILVAAALALSLKSILQKCARGAREVVRSLRDYISVNFDEFAMITFIVFYWAWSMKSPLNIGFRHLFPTLPFIYILTARAWKRWIMRIDIPRTRSTFEYLTSGFRAASRMFGKYVLFVVLLLWLLFESANAAPYFLSYFNQLGGGVPRGYRTVTDSNYDWGQDLRRLQSFVAEHPEIEKIAVDYFGGGNPKYYMGEKVEYWWSSRGNPKDLGIEWLAVSVNTLELAIQPLAPGQNRNQEDEYGWLTELRPPKPGVGNVPEPDYKAGTSIFIYKR